MARRLFISIPLPEKWQDAFVKYYAHCKARDIRWTAKENIHITACFLGDVDDARMSEVQEKLARVCEQAKPFEISFDKMDLAPPGMPPRMVWAVFQESTAYQQLAQELQEALRSFLTVEPHTETVPHATLARFNDPVLAREIDVARSLPDLASCDVVSIDLVESHLTPTGVHYKIIKTFLLGKTA